MYAFFGLGNPGKKYEYTRHNVGFSTIDYIASQYQIKINKIGFHSLYGEGVIAGEKVLLVKPQTFMNQSGKAVLAVKQYYKLQNETMIIIFDDTSLPAGVTRMRAKGSSGGQKGMKDIILSLNTDEIPRIRIGIGAPPHPDMDLADFVLGKIPKEEIPLFGKAAERVEESVPILLNQGMQRAINQLNTN